MVTGCKQRLQIPQLAPWQPPPNRKGQLFSTKWVTVRSHTHLAGPHDPAWGLSPHDLSQAVPPTTLSASSIPGTRHESPHHTLRDAQQATQAWAPTSLLGVSVAATL